MCFLRVISAVAAEISAEPHFRNYPLKASASNRYMVD
jgi:hypothetical protein